MVWLTNYVHGGHSSQDTSQLGIIIAATYLEAIPQRENYYREGKLFKAIAIYKKY